MENDPEDKPQRRKPSPGVHIIPGSSNFVLLTVNTLKRSPWLANPTVQPLLEKAWKEATAWLVSDYLLMPDHLHLFCAPHDLTIEIEGWIKYWKRIFGEAHDRPGWKFQSLGWHHRIRNGQQYSEKWLYVQENPLRKGLVKRMEGWPYRGRIHDLDGGGK